MLQRAKRTPTGKAAAPIGIFDSGYGGLTVFRAIADRLPQYDYVYLGDNARAPYGSRSFEAIREYTWECVQALFARGCPLVILACNTASARALRSIQQEELPKHFPDRRVLGVIRPTAEVLGSFSRAGCVGILGTEGTVKSGSYVLEAEKFFPALRVFQQACPMLVPLIESGEQDTDGARFFIRQYTAELLAQCPDMDAVLLACTHYPLVEAAIREALPEGIAVISQSGLVAASLEDYLARHPAMESRISTHATRTFLTTDSAKDFSEKATLFFGGPVVAQTVHVAA